MKILNLKLLFKTLLLSVAFLTMACSDDKDDYTVEDTNPLKLQATSGYTVLDNDDLDREIVTFLWEKVPDILEEGTKLEGFLFKMDKGDNSFETTIPTTQLKGDQYYKSFTTRELNELAEDWGFVLGDEVSLDVRVIAKLSNLNKFVKPYVSTIQVRVKTLEYPHVPLYLTGSASPGGTDLENATLLQDVSRMNKTHGWRGNLKTGEFVLSLSKESVYPAYTKGENNTLILKESESDPGEPFTINKDGYYAIFLNRTTLRVNCEEVWDDQNIPLYLVGDAGALGSGKWTQSEDRKLIWGYENPHVCEITFDLLGAGSFRISSWIGGNNNTAFRPISASNMIISGQPIQEVVFRNSPDRNWNPVAADKGKWKITLDTKNMTIKFNKIG